MRVPIRWAPYLLISPFLILFALFGLFPLLFSGWLAFQSWEPSYGLEAMQFVGLDNFIFAMQDAWFWKSLKNTLWLAAASGIPQHMVALPLAVLIHNHFGRLRDGVSGAYFLPYITSTVAIAMLASALFSTDYGLANALLQALGLDKQAWTTHPLLIKPTIALVVFWRYVGFNIVLYLAALQTVPRDLYEAARLDGASPWQQFWHVTLPSLRPMILFGVTLSIIGGLQLFEEPFILTNGNGGTDQQGMTSGVYLYRLAFEFSDFGGASAISWMLFGLVALLTWLTNRALGERR
ncbi:MAG: sugar ABC transporter permease [Burkholderiales bacterium]|nr:sugar ABC transporter permease [Burkholderiales bacterium]